MAGVKIRMWRNRARGKAGMGGKGTRKIAEAGVGEVVQGRYGR